MIYPMKQKIFLIVFSFIFSTCYICYGSPNHILRQPNSIPNIGIENNTFCKGKWLLSDILRRIAARYDVELIFEDCLPNKQIDLGNGVDRNLPVETILQMLSCPGGYSFIKKEDGFHLSRQNMQLLRKTP